MQGYYKPVGGRKENVEGPREEIRQDHPERKQGEGDAAEHPPRDLRGAKMGYQIRHG